MLKLEPDTILQRIPDLSIQLDSSHGLRITTPGGVIDCGRHGLAILDAFSDPTPLSEAIARLRRGVVGQQGGVELDETISGLTRAGVLHDVTAGRGPADGARSRSLAPFGVAELLAEYEREHDAISKHLLTIYSIVVGLHAQRAVEIGVGGTTRTIRAALARTGGELYSCDVDRPRWESIARENRDPRFHLCLENSRRFIASLRGPFDFVLHDGAHDLRQVAWDLEHLWPLVRRFGIICLHDTQHDRLGGEMRRALTKAFDGCAVSWTHLPYSYGLTIVRLERDQPYEPVRGHWNKAGGRSFTEPATCGLIGTSSIAPALEPLRDGVRYARSWLREVLRGRRSLSTVVALMRGRMRGVRRPLGSPR
jgi:predicted O-methyltransferase YrrM